MGLVKRLAGPPNAAMEGSKRGRKHSEYTRGSHPVSEASPAEHLACLSEHWSSSPKPGSGLILPLTSGLDSDNFMTSLVLYSPEK